MNFAYNTIIGRNLFDDKWDPSSSSSLITDSGDSPISEKNDGSKRFSSRAIEKVESADRIIGYRGWQAGDTRLLT